MSLKTFFFPLALIITFFSIVWFIFPRWGVVQEKRAELNKKMETSASLETKRLKINKSIDVYEENIRDTAVIYDALPVEINNDSFVDELFKGAQNKGALIIKIEVGDVKLAEKAKSSNKIVVFDEDEGDTLVSPEVFKIPFTLDLVGNYVEVRNFISFMETAHRLFVVENVAMNQEEIGTGSVNASISGVSFYKKDDPSLKISSVVYRNEPVLKSIVDSGLDVDFIKNYKNRFSSSNYVFSPILTGIGKDDLFLGQSNASIVEENLDSLEAEVVAGDNLNGLVND